MTAPNPLPPVGLIGLAQAGKDTTAGFLADVAGYRRLAFADALKSAALSVSPIVEVDAPLYSRVTLRRLSEVVEEYGWEGAKELPEVRRYLQSFGLGIRDLDPDFWVRVVERQAHDLIEDGIPVAVTDVRFENEVGAVRRLGGAVVKVERPGAGLSGPAAEHPSEQLARTYLPDFTVRNDGDLDGLRGRVISLVPRLLEFRR